MVKVTGSDKATNALAYYGPEFITTVKGFVEQGRWFKP